MKKLLWLLPYVIIIPTGIIYGWDEGIKWVAIFYPILPISYETYTYFQIKKRLKDDSNN